MKKTHILLLTLLPISLLLVTCGQDTPTSVSPSAVQTEITLAKNTNIDAFDMNDRLSVPLSGASGSGTVKVINGQMTLTIHARGLNPDYDYEVHVAVGAVQATCDPFPALAPDHADIFPVMSDKNGKIKFKIVGWNLGLAPGQYRLDYVVVDPLDAPFGLEDFLLACEPASCVTI